jgi:SAM-dependent methyltransferase
MTKSEFAYTGHENLLAMQHAHNYNNFLAQLIYYYGKDSETIVDFGAGVGALAQAVRPWARRLICVEPDTSQIEILRVAGYEVVDSITALPNGTVDYVYSLNVLEHIEDDRAALEQIFKVLKSGGRLLVYVPALQWLFTSMDATVGHVRRYHMSDLVQKIADTGFVIKHKEYVDSLGVPATLAYKWVGNSTGSINTKALILYDRFMFPISRIIDKLFCRVGGKNLLIVCEKP